MVVWIAILMVLVTAVSGWSTRVTPAMAAGVTDKLWDMTDVVKIVDAFEQGELVST